MPADLEFPSPPDGAPPPPALKPGTKVDPTDMLNLTLMGSVVRVSFPDKHLADEARIGLYRQQLYNFLDRTGARSLQFDLEGVNLLASCTLGFFVSLKSAGYDVELINASAFILDVLDITKLTEYLKVRRA
ncbi:MAG: hypothetical protein JSS02_07520 [Planctomycetes bacterium]|nr:hypothetical protein [Planctomycetota bacterium]